MEQRSCFMTGHRPNRFHFPEASPMCRKIKDTIETEIRRLYDQEEVRGVWVGGAAGVDTWAAEIVLALQKQEQYHGLKLYVAIPFPEHGDKFSPKQFERYQRILDNCTEKTVICHAYRPDAYKKRDYYMVDKSVCGIAVYDQDRAIRSGTGMTVNYAMLKKKLPITFIHPDTGAVQHSQAAGDFHKNEKN